MNSQSAELIRSYAERGRVKAGEVLLPRDLALQLVDDLERLDVRVDGVDFWRIHGEYVIEIPWGGDAVGSDVASRAEDVRRTIRERWPVEADYVSLVFAGYWYPFRDKWRPGCIRAPALSAMKVKFTLSRVTPFQAFVLLGLVYLLENSLGVAVAAQLTLAFGMPVLIVWSILFAMNYRGMASDFMREGNQRGDRLYGQMRRRLPRWLYNLYLSPLERRRSERGSLIARRAFHGLFALIAATLLVSWIASKLHAEGLVGVIGAGLGVLVVAAILGGAVLSVKEGLRRQ